MFLAVACTVAAQDAPGGYVLGRGDEITIKVFNRPELEDTVTIRPDGRISVVLLDDVMAAGLTPAQLDAQLTTQFAEYFRDPEITIVVRRFAGQRVYVGGEVGRPDAIELAGDLTLVGAVMHAGGFRDTARRDSVILLRNGGGGTLLVRRVDIREVLERGTGDVALQPFDVVFVPKSRIAKVDLFVDQYIRQLIPISVTAGFSYLLGATALIAQ